MKPIKIETSRAFPTVPLIVLLLAFVALSISVYLAFHLLSGKTQLAGCGGDGAGCEEVIQSRWGSWFGIPISTGGIIIYASIVFLSLMMRKNATRTQWLILFSSSLIAVFSALWFTGLQIFELHSYCFYCIGVHVCGFIIAIILLRKFPWQRSHRESKKRPIENTIERKYAILSALLAFAGVGVLAGGQLYTYGVQTSERTSSVILAPQNSETPFSETTSTTSREITLAAGMLRMKFGEFPIIGSPDAKNVVVHFFDFTCPACRKFHPSLMREQKRFSKQTALVMVPIPLEAECNPAVRETEYLHRDACAFAKIGLALWKIAPQAYDEYDKFLFQNEYPPSIETAFNVARSLAQKDQLDGALSDPATSQILRQGLVMFYSPAFNQKALPALVTRDHVFTGFPPAGVLPQLFAATTLPQPTN